MFDVRLDASMAEKTEVRPRETNLLAGYGGMLIVIGLVLTTSPLDVTGLLVGVLGVAMLTVWMLRRYR